MESTVSVANLSSYLNAIIPIMRDHAEKIADPDQSHVLLKVLTGVIGDGGAVKDVAHRLGWGDVRFMKALRGLEDLGILRIWQETKPRRTRPEYHFALAVPTAILPPPPTKTPAAPPVRPTRAKNVPPLTIPLFGEDLPAAAKPSAWGDQPPKAVMSLWDQLQGIDPATVPGITYKREASIAKSIAEIYTPAQIRDRWPELRKILPRNGRVGLMWLANNLANRKGSLTNDTIGDEHHPDVQTVTTTKRKKPTPDFFASTNK